MKRLFATLLMIAVMLLAIPVSGKVVDTSTDSPVIGAVVRLGEDYLWAIVDADGSFSFENVQPGEYVVEASCLGYVSVSVEVNAGNCNTTHPSIVELNGKTYFVTHNGTLPEGTSYSRSVCVEVVVYNADGTMQKCDVTTEGIWKK